MAFGAVKSHGIATARSIEIPARPATLHASVLGAIFALCVAHFCFVLSTRAGFAPEGIATETPTFSNELFPFATSSQANFAICFCVFSYFL